MPGADQFSENAPMTCEEFALAGLDLVSASELTPLQRAALEHLKQCPRCAALQENWLALRADLRALGRETGGGETPARTELRLLQNFHTKHSKQPSRRAAVLASWSLAAAAALVAVVSWVEWRNERNGELSVKTAAQMAPVAAAAANSAIDVGDVLVASNSSSEFTLLPGSVPSSLEDATVVRVGMQRAALGALGLTVNEEHAGDWIQVDLLVGSDGLPQAVRLPEATE